MTSFYQARFKDAKGAVRACPRILALHIFVDLHIYVAHPMFMNSKELKKWLSAHGATFQSHKGGSGHLTVRLNGRTSQLPMHGGGKELGKGLVRKIKKDLGL